MVVVRLVHVPKFPWNIPEIPALAPGQGKFYNHNTMWPMSLFLKLSPNMSKQFAKIEWCPETVVDLPRNASHSTLCRSLTLPSKVSLGPRQPLAHLLVDLAKQCGKHVTMVQRWLWEIGLQRWSKEFGCFETCLHQQQPSTFILDGTSTTHEKETMCTGCIFLHGPRQLHRCLFKPK